MKIHYWESCRCTSRDQHSIVVGAPGALVFVHFYSKINKGKRSTVGEFQVHRCPCLSRDQHSRVGELQVHLQLGINTGCQTDKGSAATENNNLCSRKLLDVLFEYSQFSLYLSLSLPICILTCVFVFAIFIVFVSYNLQTRAWPQATENNNLSSRKEVEMANHEKSRCLKITAILRCRS